MKKFTVYRHYDVDGKLLYVGRSINILSRTKTHENSKWFDLIDTIKIQHFKTYLDMCAAEAEAIRSEEPTYNQRISAYDPIVLGDISDDLYAVSLHEMVRSLRTNGYSQSKIAKVAGVSQMTVARWEKEEPKYVDMTAHRRLLVEVKG